MIKKLRIKFVVIIMCIVTLILGAILGGIWHLTRSSLETRSIDMMRKVTNEDLPQKGPMPGRDDRGVPYFVLNIKSGETEIKGHTGGFDLSDSPEMREIEEHALADDDETGVISEYNLRYYKKNIADGDNGVQQIVFADISNEISTLHNLTRTCLVGGIAAFIAFLLISIVLSKWAVRPVEKAWENQRRFISDASHELKTPLTVIMTNAQLANSEDFDSEQKGLFVKNIETMSVQMKSLIESLLQLTREDEDSNTKFGAETFDYSKSVSDVALIYEPVFYEKGLELSVDIEEDIKLNGNREKLKHIAEILLDNAAKYSIASGKTELVLKKYGDRCVLRVTNDGEPLSKEECRDIFKRFFRKDEARNRDDGIRTGSFGLGLPIAESIVTNYGGSIKAESNDGKNSFIVTLKAVK